MYLDLAVSAGFSNTEKEVCPAIIFEEWWTSLIKGEYHSSRSTYLKGGNQVYVRHLVEG